MKHMVTNFNRQCDGFVMDGTNTLKEADRRMSHAIRHFVFSQKDTHYAELDWSQHDFTSNIDYEPLSVSQLIRMPLPDAVTQDSAGAPELPDFETGTPKGLAILLKYLIEV